VHPDQEWKDQVGRSVTQDVGVTFIPSAMRDTKFCASFRSALASGGVKTFSAAGQESESERVRGALRSLGKTGVPVQTDPFGEGPLSRVLAEYSRHYHHERNFRGKSIGYSSLTCAGTDIHRGLTSPAISNSEACFTNGAPHEYLY
jgi:hypothetical protein